MFKTYLTTFFYAESDFDFSDFDDQDIEDTNNLNLNETNNFNLFSTNNVFENLTTGLTKQNQVR